MMMNGQFSKKLKTALWQSYGDPAFPAEWDGTVFGGGKLSQRFWEYHTSIDLLELAPDSVVLDIGGGSPTTGAGFFARVIAPFVREVHIMDTNIGKTDQARGNIKFHLQLASYETLSKFFNENPQITHVACISVFEHIPHNVRCGMTKAVNEWFGGDVFVATQEYHPRDCFFEQQLTSRTLSELYFPFTKFYPDEIRKSPVLSENAYGGGSLGRSILRRIGLLGRRESVDMQIPLWYPLALRFRRIAG